MNFKYHIWFCIILMVTARCGRKSGYHEMVERELAKGIREDSLFLGIQLGMTQKEFFSHCWELNHQKLVHEGPSNLTIEYKMEELDYPATMNFYPAFHEDNIYRMPVTISYDAWAPWNKYLFADSLQLDVLKFFEKKYGKGFIKIEHPKRGAAYVKVDGNRRISIFKGNDMSVKVLYTDILVEKEIIED